MSDQANDDLEVVDAMGRQISEPGMFRVASLFAEDQPIWSCFNWEIGKKSCVETVAKFILFLGMLSYIIYQLVKYFDPSVNRKEVVNIELEETMPFAYVYLDYSVNDTDCEVKFGFNNDSAWNLTYFQEWDFTQVASADDLTPQDIFDYVDTTNDCQGVYLKETVWDYNQFLFIPSKCESVIASSKDYHFAKLVCANHTAVPSDKIIWSQAGNREQLYYYDSLSDIFSTNFYQSSYIDLSYDVTFIYDWFAYENEVDDDSTLLKKQELYDYFDINIDGTYDNTEYYGNLSVTDLRFSPNDIGVKTTFQTTSDIDILDIFGLAGGMYSSIEQVLAYFTVAIIWGCSFGCCKVSGVASEAGPDGLIRQQLEGFLKARDETIVELTQRIVELEKKLDIDYHGEENNSGANNQAKRKSTPSVAARKFKVTSSRTDTIYNKTASPKNTAVTPKSKVNTITDSPADLKPMNLDGSDNV